MTDNIIISHQEKVTTLTISRIEKKNAITQEMYRQLASAINTYAADDGKRALVITGTQDVFTSGNDLSDFAVSPNGDESPATIDFLDAILDCQKPLIASVNGLAIGIGLTMLLHCDLVLASDRASFAVPFAKLGLVPEAGSSILLPRVVGTALAKDMLLTGRSLTAQEALQYGLIARLHPHDELAQVTEEVAQAMAAMAPNAMVKSKALLHHDRDQIAALMKHELDIFAAQLQSSEFMESVLAIKEKRAPVYK